MYYSRHSSHKNTAIFPFFVVIFGIWILFSPASPIFFMIMIFIVGKMLFRSALKSSKKSGIPPNRGYNSQYQNVSVNYLDTMEPHEDPENFTRAQAYCFECGTSLKSVAKFCQFCGTAQNI